MIDEKKIEEAAEKYVEFSSIEDEYPGAETTAFKEGVYWAIDEFLKGLWHDASEDPELDKDGYALIQFKDDTMMTFSLKWLRELGGTKGTLKNFAKRWLYIDDLTKEGGEK